MNDDLGKILTVCSMIEHGVTPASIAKKFASVQPIPDELFEALDPLFKVKKVEDDPL